MKYTFTRKQIVNAFNNKILDDDNFLTYLLSTTSKDRPMNQKLLDKNKIKELNWEKVAFLFHNTYEGLAPKFGYETRKDTKAFDTKSQNGQLMIETCKAVVSHFLTRQRTELLEEIPKKIKGKNKEFVEGYNNAIDDITNLLNKKDV